MPRRANPQEKAVWRNVNARFPGFTSEISELFWNTNEMESWSSAPEKFLRIFVMRAGEMDLSDRLDSASAPPSAENYESTVADWIGRVMEYQSFIEDIIDGKTLIPPTDLAPIKLEEEIRNLQKANRDLELKNKTIEEESKTIDDIDPKELTSLYKFIIGHYPDFDIHVVRSRTTSRVMRKLDPPYSLSDDTIRRILREAKRYLTEKGIV
jgi:hypothetical protein